MPNQILQQEARSLRVAWVVSLLILGSGGAQVCAQSAPGVQLPLGSHSRSLHVAAAFHGSGAWPPFFVPYVSYGWTGWMGPAYPVAPFDADCLLFPNCAGWVPGFAPYLPLMARRQKSPSPAKVYGEPHQPDAAMVAWRASLRPAPAPFRTDERQIQPPFRNHSLIRPEFEQAGQPLPTFPPK